MLKKILLGGLGLIVLVVLCLGGYIFWHTSAYDDSMSKVYDIEPLSITAATDPVAIERGRHLSESLAGCALADCHGTDFAGGKVLELGPLGTMSGPNITLITKAYSDGELARLIRHGVKKDGRSARFMPSNEFGWLPDEDLAALIGYLRTVKPVERPNGPMEFGVLAKVLDRRGEFAVDVARRVNSQPIDIGPAPSPTKEYGAYVVRLCTGCHGDQLGGGAVPGAPPEFPVPLNLTPDPSGLTADYTYEQFNKFIADGVMLNGKKADAFMPIVAMQHMNETERKALYAYMRSVEPRPMGSR